MLPRITQLRKCGRYDIVCTVFRKVFVLSSLIISAKITLAGKPKISLYRLINSVLRTDCQKIMLRKSTRKCFSPTHELPEIPLRIAKSLNASCTPYIGK